MTDMIHVKSIERNEVERNVPLLVELKTMKPGLFNYLLRFDLMVNGIRTMKNFW
jgi:hypothetical protein